LLSFDFKSNGPALADGTGKSAADFDLDAGPRRPDLDPRLAHPAAFLDDHIAVTHASAHRNVAVSVDALFAAQGADAVSIANPLGARWERDGGGTCHGDCKGEDMDCSHLWSP
jgi:hypothetical protein